MKKEYANLLKHPLWQKKRLEIFQRDNWTCKKCGDTETSLNVHHTYYDYDIMPWEYSKESLITLCEHCHTEIEYLKEEENFDFNKIKIFKSNGWQNGNRIMFTYHCGMCLMAIYDNNDNRLTGFNFKYDIPGIIKILKYTQKNGM